MRELLSLAFLVILSAASSLQASAPDFWHFTINDDGKFVRSDTGAVQFLVTADSPETGLWTLDFPDLIELDELGADGLYLSLWSGDDPGLEKTLWIDPLDKQKGFDLERTLLWRDKIETWCSLDSRNYVIFVFLEEEHFLKANDPYFAIDWGEWLHYLDWVTAHFGDFPQIQLLCEESRYSPDAVVGLALSMQERSIHPVGIHPPGHFKPWADYSGLELAPWVKTGAIDVFFFQEFDPTETGFLLGYWWAKCREAGLRIAVVAEEMGYDGNGIPSDSAGGVAVGMDWLWRGWPWSAGWGLYSGYADDGCTDLRCPEPGVHRELWRHAAASARAIEEFGDKAPVLARLLYDVPVPVIVADRNGDGVVDSGD